MNEKIKILIVDDHQVNRMTLKLSLKNEGYEFFEATNGLEAIQKATEVNPDVILMDALMPYMDGFEATKEIREIEEIRRVPILMITSLDQKEDKIKALQYGVNDFISKPFDKLELKARCKSYAQISILNKKYTLANKNPITNLSNKMALLKDIEKNSKNKELFIIKIDNFNMNENFYGTKIAQKLEIEFVKTLHLNSHMIGHYNTYHISTGRYAILVENDIALKKESVIKFCTHFTEHVKRTKYSYEEYHFDVNITMSFAIGKDALFEDANAILMTAINEKRDFLLSYDSIDAIKDNLKGNLEMLKNIKMALKYDKIIPYFQPIHNIKSNNINRYEALVRMIDDEGNITLPGPYFLNVAKKGKLYSQVTKILFQKVVEKIRKHQCEISVNLSSIDIEDVAMSEYLLSLLEKNSDITDKLIFELLEDKDTQDYEYVNSFISKARSYGVKIAIDDFGSGYSNFIRIIEFKPDIIKIDGSLIENIEHSDSSRKTVEAIKIFADKIGAKTVAEYVKNQEIYFIIKEIDIDYAQGYYIGKPEPLLICEKELEISTC